MATQREKDAADYLQKHRIPELLENMSSLLFFHRPGPDPPEPAKLVTANANANANTERQLKHEAN